MPLFLDYHKMPNVKVEDAKKAHLADESIQKKYGVNYLQFWCNEQAGALFCLVEGPDQETCENVHRLAHGHVACAIVEVDPTYYSLVMGSTHKIDGGVVLQKNGEVDLGYRSILTINFHYQLKARSTPKPPALKLVSSTMARYAGKQEGRILETTGDHSLTSVFNSSGQAIKCAMKIQAELAANRELKFSIGVASGKPINEQAEFIQETIRLASRLSLSAEPGNLYISTLAAQLGQKDIPRKAKKLRILTEPEEALLTELFDLFDTDVAKADFAVDSVVRRIGLSRPQLYRKIHALTGRAPNDVIRDLRLEKALSLLKQKSGNIAHVAFESGFGNPSYFTKCFTKKFGGTPSQYLSVVAD